MAFELLSNSILLSIWSFICFGALIYYVGLVIYRYWLHPLARFPGPKVAALTYIYEGYYDLIRNGGSQYPSKIRKLHAQYGPVIRINPNGKPSLTNLLSIICFARYKRTESYRL